MKLPSVYGAEENLLELPAEGEVDEEVGGGVDHQGELVQAGQAEEPGRRVEVRATSGNFDLYYCVETVWCRSCRRIWCWMQVVTSTRHH